MPEDSAFDHAGRHSGRPAFLTDVVPAGLLEAPSGLELHDGLIYVTDNAMSVLYAFELDGRQVRSLSTGLLSESLAGLSFGPDGKVYFTDLRSGKVVRIDPL